MAVLPLLAKICKSLAGGLNAKQTLPHYESQTTMRIERFLVSYFYQDELIISSL